MAKPYNLLEISETDDHLFFLPQSAHMLPEDEEAAEEPVSSKSKRYHSSVPDFPRPAGREFILRTSVPRPAPYSQPTPQRMYCVLVDEDFRIAGAFSQDTTFQ